MNFAITRNVRSWVGEKLVDMRHKLGGGGSEPLPSVADCHRFCWREINVCVVPPPPLLYRFLCLEPRLEPAAHLDHRTAAGKGRTSAFKEDRAKEAAARTLRSEFEFCPPKFGQQSSPTRFWFRPLWSLVEEYKTLRWIPTVLDALTALKTSILRRIVRFNQGHNSRNNNDDSTLVS